MMIKKIMKFLILGAFLLGILVIVLFMINSKADPYKAAQLELARNLGVEVSNYPNPKIFPVGYFRSVLNQNSTLEDVHKVVSGYKKVYRCGGLAEIYYYYSEDDGEALRFQIIYNNNLKFKTLQGEDEDSRYLNPNGCVEGRITEK